jgi:hypothetical protein
MVLRLRLRVLLAFLLLAIVAACGGTVSDPTPEPAVEAPKVAVATESEVAATA